MAKTRSNHHSKTKSKRRRQNGGDNVAANAAPLPFANSASEWMISKAGLDITAQQNAAGMPWSKIIGGKSRSQKRRRSNKRGGSSGIGTNAEVIGQGANLATQGGKKRGGKRGGSVMDFLVPFGLVGLSQYAHTRKQRKH